MPLYSYQCDDCEEHFLELRRISEMDNEIDCPNCGSAQTHRKVTRAAISGSSSGCSTCASSNTSACQSCQSA
ncbi:MAG: zinc ribbon domain-containing protein [Proteobacteria bacterium]|nr:zinc ribbon domain-containing protein [Pseudomonadota bacterium]